MNTQELAKMIYHMPLNHQEKKQRLRELIVDCRLELEAQNENMHPEIARDLAEGLRVATDYQRCLCQ